MTLRKLCGNKMLLLSLVLVIIWLFLALISPWIVPQDPFAVHMEERLQAGSMIHWMGRILWGVMNFPAFCMAPVLPWVSLSAVWDSQQRSAS